MEPPEHADGQPTNPAAERLPAGSACIGCRYDLAGLTPENACPECGLNVAASWPVWDLGACHRAYVDHVRAELGGLGWASALAAFVALGFAVAVALEPWTPASAPPSVLQAVSATAAMVAVILTAIPLARFEHRWRGHPRPSKELARAPRQACTIGVWVMAIGMVAMLLPGSFIVPFAPALGVLIASMGVAVMLIGAMAIYFAVMGYARLALERDGLRTPAGWRDWAWPLLILVGLLPMPLWRVATFYAWWSAALALLGASVALAVLAGRCARARAALERR